MGRTMQPENHSHGLNRKRLIQEALEQGVPLHKIEAYLDWRESVQQAAPEPQRQALPRPRIELPFGLRVSESRD